MFAALEAGLPAQQPGGGNAGRQLRQLGPELGGKAAQLQASGGGRSHCEVAQQRGQPLKHRPRVAAPLQQLPTGFHHGQRFSGGEGRRQGKQLLLRHRPEQLPDGAGLHRSGQETELVQQAFGIAQAALGPLGYHMQGFGRDADRFEPGNLAQVGFDRLQGNAAEIEALATGQDRGQHPLGIGGGQHEHHPRWRFLQGLEQRIEGGGREHVALVDHVDLPAGLHRCEARAFDQLPDVVDAGVGGRIDLDHIEGIARRDRAAQFTDTAGFGGGAVGGDAVERAGQDPRAGGLAGAARAAEQIGGRDAPLPQGVAERGHDRLLPHQLVEALGAVFVMERLIGAGLGHGGVPGRPDQRGYWGLPEPSRRSSRPSSSSTASS